jgi:hypothetical protein
MADVPNTWPLNGYAPGNYWCRCLTCNDDFQGDKRAYQCLECAVSQIRGLLADLLSERERRTAQGVTVPAGWALVPIEPTQAMLDEACSTAPHVIITYTKPHERDGSVPLIPVATWRAMLAARPAAPSLSTSAGGGERG